jgi:hypothetical protein
LLFPGSDECPLSTLNLPYSLSFYYIVIIEAMSIAAMMAMSITAKTARIPRPGRRPHLGILEDGDCRRAQVHRRELEVFDDPGHGPELRDETEAKSRVSFLCSKDF